LIYCLTAEEVLIRAFEGTRTVPLTVTVISILSVFVVIFEGVKLRGCASHEYTLTLTWGLSQPTKKLTCGEGGRSGGHPLLS